MRKKFTMLLASLLACIGVVKAGINEELVSKKITFNSEEYSNELNTGIWYILNNHNRNNCVSEEETVLKMRAIPKSGELAQNVAGMLFKLTEVQEQDQQYYIVSGNGLYFDLGDNQASISENPVAYTIGQIKETEIGHFYIQEINDSYIADGQGTGDSFVGYGTDAPATTGGNNCYHFIPVTLEEVELLEVTYNYFVGNEKMHTETVTQINGSDVAAPTFNFVSFEAPEGTISESNKTFDIECTLGDIPVTFSTIENPVWQIVEMHRYDGNRYWQYNNDSKQVDVVYYTNNKVALASDDKLWCFVGNHFGFSIYNKQAGTDVTLNATDGLLSVGTASNGNNLWRFASSTASTEGNAICFTHDGVSYMNRTDKGIGYYQQADNGSTCYIYDPAEIVLPLAQESLLNIGENVPNGAIGTYSAEAIVNITELTSKISNNSSYNIEDVIDLSNLLQSKVAFSAGYYRLICHAPKTGNSGDTNNNTLTYDGGESLVTAPTDNQNRNQIFKFVSVPNSEYYYLQIPGTDKYLNKIAAGNYRAKLVDQNSACEINLIPYNAYAQYEINNREGAHNHSLFAENNPNDNPPYACAGWDDGVNSASAWYLVPVTDAEIADLFNFVAKVGTEYYETLQGAIDAAEAGATVTLIDDITSSEIITIDKSMTLDGNGKTLTYKGSDRAITVENNTEKNINLTINNLTVAFNSNYCQRGINYNEQGSLVLNNVKVNGNANVTYAVNLPGSSNGAIVSIDGCTLIGNIALNIWGANATINVINSALTSVDDSEAENYAAIVLNNNGENSADGTTVTVTGGSITALDENDDESNAVSISAPTGTVTVSETTVVTGVNPSQPVAVVTYADIIEFYSCESLQEAVDQVVKDQKGSIKLIRDIVLEEAIAVGGAVTLDLNGKSITRADDYEGYVFEVTGELIVTGGTIAQSGICYIINDADYKTEAGKTYAISEDKESVDIEYTRTFGHTNWQVLFVPFNIKVTEELLNDFEVYRITGVNEVRVEVADVTEGTTLSAHTPYLIKAKEIGEKTITATNVTLEATKDYVYSEPINGYTFTGIYTSEAIAAHNKYVLTDGKWCRLSDKAVSDGNNVLGAFRVYLTAPDGTQANALSITRGETGIEELSTVNDQQSTVIYDLTGRKVETMDKGIYIVNGRKVVIK